MVTTQRFSRSPQKIGKVQAQSNALNTRLERKDSSDTKALFYVSGRRPVESLLSKCKSRPGHVREHILKLVFLALEPELPGTLARISALAQQLGIQVSHCSDPKQFPAPADENHQRVCLVLREYPTTDLEDIVAELKELFTESDNTTDDKAAHGTNFKGCVGLILDQIQDPRNFGAILRSAAFFGQKFVVFGKDRQAMLSPLVYRSSAGGATELDLVEVTNIRRTIEALKEAGLWVVVTACDDTSVVPDQVPLDRPYVLVLGNEEKGVRQEIMKAADYKVKIPGGIGSLESLNVSVAAGVALYALTQRAH